MSIERRFKALIAVITFLNDSSFKFCSKIFQVVLCNRFVIKYEIANAAKSKVKIDNAMLTARSSLSMDASLIFIE